MSKLKIGEKLITETKPVFEFGEIRSPRSLYTIDNLYDAFKLGATLYGREIDEEKLELEFDKKYKNK